MNLRFSRVCLLKNLIKHEDKLEEKNIDNQKKYIENSLIFNGFYKKTFKERLDQVYISMNFLINYKKT